MSAGVKLRVRTSKGEVEIEVNDLGTVDQVIDAASRLVKVLDGGVARPQPPAEAEEAQPAMEAAADLPPSVKLEKDDSLPDILVRMFASQWGRKPRKLMEVKSALDSYGAIYPKQSVAVALMRLTKDGKLRRFKVENEYVYVAGSELVPVEGGG